MPEDRLRPHPTVAAAIAVERFGGRRTLRVLQRCGASASGRTCAPTVNARNPACPALPGGGLPYAGAGAAAWLVADEPIVATACVVAADLIGAAMMTPKTYRDPESETLITFALASLSGAPAAGVVGAVDVSLLLYPPTSASSTARSRCSSTSGDTRCTAPPF
jgi:hypothetical protein